MKTLSLILTAALALPCILTGAEKPNVIFIFSDDQCFETIGAHGLADIDTPNLDRLVKEGATFSHAYNMGSWTGAVCVASRTCLNTGASLWKARDALEASKKGERKMWSEIMADAGYATYMTGKWHVSVPTSKIFDHTKNVRAGMPKSNNKAYNRPVEGEDPATAWHPWDKKQGGFWEGGKHWSEVLADDATGYLADAAKSDKPFFMYLAFNAPHDPRQSPKEFIDRYPLDRIKIPENYIAEYPDMGTKGVPKIRDENLAPYPRTEYAIKVHRQEYFALITHMDEQIGKIFEALEKTGKADNTYIIFTSDHGLAVGHHGLVGKQNMYEDSLRPPFMIMGPGIKGGTVIDAPIYLQDAMATAIEISGQEIPENIDYKSVLPLLDGRREKNYDRIFGAYEGTQRTVIDGGWKIIAYPQLGKKKLFNLSKDPMEMNDLAANPEYAAKLSEMSDILEKTMDELGDPMDSLTKANYPKQKKEKSDH
ncbi:MAG: sulfatase-like hydrolase/transferase [Akkermansiaceae bacterium]|jgi:arylsulfatase A-like enzyme|nr:sulfatase-like hydrolase/transferase [Akkermansiaceae bacterium]MDP4722094.1 sulfatase-like hydrolase/transferase [Akkermansiaceae bacterium]MDP4781456.1 sulfatase-like hydrolase/transferase [Akkermansiaceae bacterium]MDP4899106.1 sulfatase-like hydrolase/transferase [Akkermansiaceae bacterium]